MLKHSLVVVGGPLFQEAVRPWESDVKSVADRPRAPAEVPGWQGTNHRLIPARLSAWRCQSIVLR